MISPVGCESDPSAPLDHDPKASENGGSLQAVTHRVLVIDHDATVRSIACRCLDEAGIAADEAETGILACAALERNRYDVVLVDAGLLDIHVPGLYQCLRQHPGSAHLKIVAMATGQRDARLDVLVADDYLHKPFGAGELLARVKVACRLNDLQRRCDSLSHDLFTASQELQHHLNARDADLLRARNALVLALAKLVEYRDTETGAHLFRLEHYTHCLAEEAAHHSAFADQIDATFLDLLDSCTPLHDIGKLGLPDHILRKPGKLDADEHKIMETHTLIGAETLTQVARQQAFALGFLQMATDIARHHHERYDGAGYPDHLAGDDIPLAARLVAISDVYDALRSRRVYKPALSHAATMEIMEYEFDGHFDPALLPVWQQTATRFDRIFEGLQN